MQVLDRRSIARVVVVVLVGSFGVAVAFDASSAGDPASPHPTAAAVGSVGADVAAAHALGQEGAYEGGRAACRRCHLREYRGWQRTPHADAFEVLPEESRTDPACVKCHVTGYEKEGGFTSIDATPNLAGVGCEVCHGPGSVYKDEDIMKDRDASIAAGLLIPNEQTCLGCHNSESPNFPGTFDFEAAKAEGVHEISR